MTTSRIFQSTSLQPKQIIQLDEKASHHLARVLRVSVGDKIILFNGEGGEYPSVIKEINKKFVTVEIKEFIARDVESPIAIHLAQGIARGEKMDFIIQKAVELGVKSITPLVTERCNVKLDQSREEKRLLHWRAITISACEQSGRNTIPLVHSPITLEEWLPQVETANRFVLTPHVSKKLTQTSSSPDSAVLLIGPEGGLSEKEIANAIAHQFMPLNLGPRVLRTETAPIAAISVLQFKYGDLS